MIITNINLNIKELIKKRGFKVGFAILSIIAILTIIVYTVARTSNILNGTVIKNVVDKIGSKDNIFNMQTFYSEYEMTIKSNKTVNTYSIKEWWKKDVGTKFSYIDSIGDKVSVMFKNNSLTVLNENQKNIIQVDPYTLEYSNLMSISTILNLYSEKNRCNCCFKINSYEKAGKFKIIVEKIVNKNCSCNMEGCICKSIINNISKLELRIDKNTGLPDTYIVYDNSKKECMSIVYNKFSINDKIENSIFNN